MLKEYKNIPVLITGAEGFIGSHLAGRLAAAGAKVAALVQPGVSLRRLSGIEKKIKIYPVDIRRQDTLSQIVAAAAPRKVFHLAAVADVDRSLIKFAPLFAVNLGGTLNLLRSLEKIDYDAMVTTCTAEAYGNNPPPFREDMVLDPISPYSCSKVAATLLCKTWADLGAKPITILRLFLVYGPAQGREKFLPQLIEAGLSGRPLRMTAGEQRREYTYIDDIIEGFLLAGKKPSAGGRVLNLGSGRDIALRELVAKVESILGRPVVRDDVILPYRKNEIPRIVGDHSRAEEELGWRPATGLDSGLAKTIEWYRQNLST